MKLKAASGQLDVPADQAWKILDEDTCVSAHIYACFERARLQSRRILHTMNEGSGPEGEVLFKLTHFHRCSSLFSTASVLVNYSRWNSRRVVQLVRALP
jgi:hypothetical protein